jgi:DNA polymerase III epsilon subunit-like protein
VNIYLDTETTGFGSKNRVYQLAYIIENNSLLSSYEVMCNPDVPMSSGASKVTGVYNRDLIGKPFIYETEEWDILNKNNDNRNILFIHNAKFDLEMLSYDGFISKYKVVDTLKLARKLCHYEKNKLELIRKNDRNVANREEAIMKSLGLKNITSHDALGDVVSMKAFVDMLVSKYGMNRLLREGRYVHKYK